MKRPGLRRALAQASAAALLAALLASTLPAHAQGDEPPAQTFAALEAAGLRFGRISVRAEDIFDSNDTREDRWLFRLANRLHLQTRPEVVERALLFKSGEPVSVRLIEETERLLRSQRYLYDVKFRVLEVHDGLVDIEVVTRDTWSLDIGTSASRAGGASAGGVHVSEYNLLGTGTTVTLGRSRNVDRSSTAIGFSNTRAFGSWTELSFNHAVNSDGRRDSATVLRPFYALDTRWAAGLSASQDDRIDAVYRAGSITSRYRHQQTQGEAFAGWSPGLVDGWVHRLSLGLAVQDDAYRPEAGMAAPPLLPPDRRLRSPFVRWELVEDRFDRELNRNLIGRPEFFSVGLNTTVQLGQALRGLGSSESALLYNATVSRGFEPHGDATLMAAAKLSGRLVSGQARSQRLDLQSQVYLPQSPRWLFYAAAEFQTLKRPDPDEALILGGEDGLRGYPLRYQSGTHRALFTVEERFFTDIYLWRLFRLGGAAFVDVGRAWGGAMTNPANPGWLGNAGLGLRIVNARSAFSNVLHIDLAMPLNGAPDVKKLQFGVKTRTSF